MLQGWSLRIDGRTGIKGVWRFLRAGWLLIGSSAALLLFAESCYRVQGSAREAFRGAWGEPHAPSPLNGTGWYDDFVREEAGARLMWSSYVYWRGRAFAGRLISIDSVGHRHTPQRRVSRESPLRVYFFGGSTMWGLPLRAEHTIPAEAARRLQGPPGTETDVEVTNLGERGYVFTQEVIALILRLRAGDRPNVVVFYDGANEVGSTIANEEPGQTLNEGNRAAEFASGRERDEGLAGALSDATRSVLNRLTLIKRLQSLVRLEPFTVFNADSVERSIVRTYVANVQIVESLSRDYGFTPLYVWQPQLLGTDKLLTEYEREVTAELLREKYYQLWQEVGPVLPHLVHTAVAPMVASRFVDATSAFRGIGAPIFLDECHTTEAATARIVDAIWPALDAAVTEQRERARVITARPVRQ